MIYLDNAATTKPKKEVLKTIVKSLSDDWYNPSSQYIPSQNAKNKVNNARKIIANKIHCSPEEIYFTSSGSESNNMAIKGFLDANAEYQLICDNFMHSSVRNIKKHKVLIDNNFFGTISLSHLEKLILNLSHKKDKQPFVSIVGANNEIGTIQDIKSISNLVHKNNGVLHVDAVQLFADSEINVKMLGIDIMSISGHKIGCPSGIAALYVKKGLKLSPIISGEQENQLRGGTENTAYILGFAKAVEMIDYSIRDSIKDKRNYLIELFSTIPSTYLVGEPINRLSNNANICFKSIDASALISYLDLFDIYCSGGSACNSFSLEPSHVLTALKMPEEDLHCCVRFSLNEEVTYKDIEKVFMIINNFIKTNTLLLEKNIKIDD